MVLKDRFGRPVTNLRISVTQKCNLSCIFCHKEGETGKANSEMTVEEIGKIVDIASFFGIHKVKLTGGEPLLRKDICEIVSRIRENPKIEEISLTTNGWFLADLAVNLKKAGLNRVNVNLASLNPEIYRLITGFDGVDRVKEGLYYALKAGLTPIKLNMVVLKTLNENEVWDMANFVSGKDMILQLIELENLGDAKNLYKRYYVSLDEIEEKLRLKADKIIVRKLHNRMVYCLDGERIKVELVRPFHNSNFCMNCRRLRVTASGMLKPCLMRTDNHVDIISAIRMGESEEKLREIFLKAIMLREPFFK